MSKSEKTEPQKVKSILYAQWTDKSIEHYDGAHILGLDRTATHFESHGYAYYDTRPANADKWTMHSPGRYVTDNAEVVAEILSGPEPTEGEWNHRPFLTKRCVQHLVGLGYAVILRRVENVRFYHRRVELWTFGPGYQSTMRETHNTVETHRDNF